MTVYLRTLHFETVESRNGRTRSNRVVTQWHMPITPEEAAYAITVDGGRAVRVLPPFKDTRWT